MQPRMNSKAKSHGSTETLAPHFHPVGGYYSALGIVRMALDVGWWVLDIVYWVLGIGCWMLDIGRWALDLGPWALTDDCGRRRTSCLWNSNEEGVLQIWSER